MYQPYTPHQFGAMQGFPPMMQQMQQQQAFPQPMTQQQAPQGIAGRIVASADDIAPNEVPMDGTLAFFPASDGSSIFARAWQRDGTIATIRYVPERREEDEAVVTGPTLDDVMDSLSDIQNLLRDGGKAKAPAKKPKKGGSDDASD